MIKILTEVLVPEDDCIYCDDSYIFDSFIGRVCTRFNNVMLAQKDGKSQRCDDCKIATIKRRTK